MKYQFESAAFTVVRAESADTVQQLRDDAIEFYQPINSQELFAVTRIALAQAKLLRCDMIDAGYHMSFLNECARPGGLPRNLLQPAVADGEKVAAIQNRSLCLSTGFDRLSRESDSFQLYIRYYTLCERLFRRAIEDFERLKKLRPKSAEQEQRMVEEPAGPEPELLPPPDPNYERPYTYDPTVRNGPLSTPRDKRDHQRRNPSSGPHAAAS